MPSARRATVTIHTSSVFQSISIHALREEGDRNAKGQQTVHFIFLSTPSARRATDYYVPQFANLGISIHALREEGDMT